MVTTKRWWDKTLWQMLVEVAAERGERPALIYGAEVISYNELRVRASRLAGALMQLGIKPGDNIGVWMVNRPEWIITEFAAAKVGASIVSLNSRYKTSELDYILKDAECTTLVIGDRFQGTDYLGMTRELLPEIQGGPGECRLRSAKYPSLRWIISASNEKQPGMLHYATLLDQGQELEGPRVDPLDTINILYTSGTTSLPKGAQKSHRNLLPHAERVSKALGITSEDINLLPIPFCGDYGLQGIMQCLTSGACGVIPFSAEPGELLSLIQKYRVTVFNGLDVIFKGLMAHPDFSKADLSSLRVVPAPGEPSAAYAFEQRLPHIRVIQAYGLSETNSYMLFSDLDDPLEERVKTSGKAREGTEIKIVDLITGEPVPEGENGEICFRGFNVTKGYYKHPEATAKAIDSEGWFHTGDLGVKQGDYYYYVDRIKQILKIKGFTFSPREVEDFLIQHPKVEGAQMVAASYKGEPTGVVFVRLKSGEDCSREEIIEFCKGKMASYKIPSVVAFVEAFPVTEGPHGDKVQKHKLEEMAREVLAKGN